MSSRIKGKLVDFGHPPPRNEKPIHTCFKRLETDDEYRARLTATGIGYLGYEYGESLDKIGEAFGKQRRIVEDVA